ncbi:formate dehydrogenase subunit delta [Arboricoccus pini]|uniref:formate dehydrogenase subunit delta n=1 Tax=Arboricoccus pini TaxID=1963835 RepID=UPI000B510EF4|nr:formate dehydrogenase subunit delta [Arboricoccus pini]
MANQIATFFASKPFAEGVSQTADHIRQFWDPRMRASLCAHLEAGGVGLSPLALAAARELACQPAPPHDPVTWTSRDSTEADAGYP